MSSSFRISQMRRATRVIHSPHTRSFTTHRASIARRRRTLLPLTVSAFSLTCLIYGVDGITPFKEIYAEALDDDHRQHYELLKRNVRLEVTSQDEGETSTLEDTVLAQANSTLEKISQSRTADGLRVDTCSLPSNSLLGEDRWACTVGDYELSNNLLEKLMTFSIYDGHAGHATADFLSNSLDELVFSKIGTLYESGISNEFKVKPGPRAIEKAIVSAFLLLDATIMGTAEAALKDPNLPPTSAQGVRSLAPALSGSCALLALFHPSTYILRVACVGDSRAVLGRADISNKYYPIPLSTDQTGFNPSEVARISSEHPSDEKIIDPKTGRVHGIAVSRAFGDARWKWTDEMMKDAAHRFWAHGPRPGGVIKTPPYLTALPEIKHIEIKKDSAHPDFLIMASDGFWDIVSNEDAVHCVQQWIEAKRTGSLKRIDQSITSKQIHAEKIKGAQLDQDLCEEGGQLKWKVSPKHFTVEDSNCATHLLRNALGGKRRSLFCSTMSISPPLSRDVRDDITIHVIFFGKV